MTVLDDRAVVDGAHADTSTPTRRPRRENLETQRPNRSRAAQRAIERRRNRVAAESVASDRGAPRGQVSRRSLFTRARSVPFVVPVLALLVVGLGLSLWLSTRAAQDSYRLGIERKTNQALLDRRDSLKRSYESGDSAPELSDKAAKLGMIPVQNPARMVIGANGKPKVLGDPEPASGKPIGTINPDDKPDPTSKIDKSKVSDSMGLGGDSSTGQNSNSAGQSPDATDSGAADQSSASPSPGSPAPNSPAPSENTAPNQNTVPNQNTAPNQNTTADRNADAPGAPSGLNPNVAPSGSAPSVAGRSAPTNGNPPSANSAGAR